MKRGPPLAARAMVIATGILVGLGSACLNPRPEDFPSNEGYDDDSAVDAPESEAPPDDLGSSPGNGGTPPAEEFEPPPDAGAPDAGAPDAGTGCSEADAAH